MARYTEIKKINSDEVVADYRIFETDETPEAFFIRVIKSQNKILCSINEDISHPFFELDLSDPNFKDIPLSQSAVAQHMFVRGICKIIQAYEQGNLPDELSICN